MIDPRISADWSTNKPIAAFSCTQREEEVHTQPEVLHLTPGRGIIQWALSTQAKICKACDNGAANCS